MEECRHFTFYLEDSFFPNTCFLYSSECTSITQCDSCESGHITCLSPPPSTTTSRPTTPATTTSTTTSLATSSQSPPAQCQDYKVLDDSSRNKKHVKENFADCLNLGDYSSLDWKGEAWYRIMAPAGRFIPERSPGSDKCGTWGSGYINGAHPAVMSQTKTAEVCFDRSDYDDHDECTHQMQIEVTKCDEDFYVY